MKQPLIIAGILVLLIADLGFSAYQHLQQPLHGDLVAIVLPSDHYARVLEEPFGLPVIREGARYAATNRYVVHQALFSWFHTVPLWLQDGLGLDPVQSLYGSVALFKTLLQLLFYLLLGTYIRGGFRPQETGYWAAVLFVAPFFQVFGFRSQMGIIDPSVVYSFSYALTLWFLLLFFYPFFRACLQQRWEMPAWQWVLWLALALALAFSSPLVGPLTILAGGGMLGLGILGKLKLPRSMVILLGFALLINAYSFYIGTFNIENAEGPGLLQRYALLPTGLAKMAFTKLAWPALLIALGSGLVLFRKRKLHERYPRVWGILMFLFGVIATFVLLLPLGGYRPYRPYIIRYDTFMPGTLVVIMSIGILGKHLLTSSPGSNTSWFKKPYFWVMALLMVVFWNADRPKPANACEKAFLLSLVEEPDLPFPEDCPVLSWKPVKDPKEAEAIRTMLTRWRLVD